MKFFSHKKRPVDLGPFPLEALPRLVHASARPIGLKSDTPGRPVEQRTEGPLAMSHALERYAELLNAQNHWTCGD